MATQRSNPQQHAPHPVRHALNLQRGAVPEVVRVDDGRCHNLQGPATLAGLQARRSRCRAHGRSPGDGRPHSCQHPVAVDVVLDAGGTFKARLLLPNSDGVVGGALNSLNCRAHRKL